MTLIGAMPGEIDADILSTFFADFGDFSGLLDGFQDNFFVDIAIRSTEEIVLEAAGP